MANQNTAWVWVAIIVGGILLFSQGAFDGFLGNNNSDGPNQWPSDLEATVTLNTEDELSTTGLAANVSYYLFDSDGNYIREGTTSAGTTSFDVATGQEFKLILYDDDDTGYDYTPLETTFSTDGQSVSGRALKTINYKLKRESNATIDSVQDPVDLDSNISVGQGQTATFTILISTDTSSAALYKPVIRLNANSTSVEELSIAGMSSIDCGNRLTQPQEGRRYYCFGPGETLTSQEGIRSYTATVLFKNTASGAPKSKDEINVSVIDSQMWKEANYKTKGYSAFHIGTEDKTDDSNIGATSDPVEVSLMFE